MAATYNLLRDFPGGDDMVSQSPYWVLGIVRFANQVTYNPNLKAQTDRGDVTKDPIGELPPLVLTKEVSQIRISSAKDSHVTNLSATLYPHANFLAQVRSGDWVICCITNSETQGVNVADRMRNGQQVNLWGDGLKFMGRVQTIQKQFSTDPNGVRNTSFSLQCVGFGEMDTYLYYHPQLEKQNSTPAQLKEFGLLITQITDGTGPAVQRGLIVIDKIIPALISTIFGDGVWATAVGGAGSSASPNEKLVVPQTICKWLGVPTAKTYNDVLVTMTGLQHYQTVNGATSDSTSSWWDLFQPDGLMAADGVLKTPTPMAGWFPLAPPPHRGSAWEIISGFSNSPLNEMYVTLRADQGGAVMPHFIVRQIPYSTNQAAAILADYKAAAEAEEQKRLGPDAPPPSPPNPAAASYAYVISKADFTDFLELPRWRLPSVLVTSGELGRSDALRFNFVHVAAVGQGNLTDETGGFVRAPPISDGLDIKRSGIRPYMVSVNSTLYDLVKGPKFWQDLMADVVMGQHLTLSGQLSCVGIQAPIAVGDNVEFDGLCYT